MKIASRCSKFVGIFLLLAVLAGCGTKESTDKPETPLQQAYYYLDSWQIESARDVFDKLGREDISQPWSDYGEAMAFERQFLFYDALGIFFRLAKDHPNFAPGLEGMSRVLGYLDFPIDAILPATTLTTLLPDRAEYRYRDSRRPQTWRTHDMCMAECRMPKWKRVAFGNTNNRSLAMSSADMYPIGM